MQSFLSKIISFKRGVQNSILLGFVIFGTFALFAQLTSPYDIKVKRPEEKLIKQQIAFGEMYDKAKPANEMEERILVTSKAVYCSMFGMVCNSDYDTFSTENFDKSMMGKVTGLISTPFTNPPALGSYYVLHSLDEAGFIPDSYAAEGLGFAGLAPFIHIWKKLRDISFLIIALAMIISGFLIMFRAHMDPQHAIKLENSLPKIILAIILINFSFAIAGFMIDIMYIMTGIIIVTFGPLINPDLSLSSMLDRYVSPGPLDLINLGVGNFEGTFLGFFQGIKHLIYNLPHALLGMFGDAIRSFTVTVSGMILGIMLFWWIGGKVRLAADTFDSPVIAAVIWLIVMALLIEPIFKISFILPVLVVGLIISLTVFWIFMQLLILTFRTYIKLLFYIMLSPLILIGEALPGSKVFVPWLQTICVELLTFPLMITIFLLSGAFSNAISNGHLLSLPFVAAINPENLGIIVSFGILFTMPELIMMVKEKLNTQTMSVPALSIGTFFKGGAEPVKAMLAKPRGLIFMSEVVGKTGPIGKIFNNKFFNAFKSSSGGGH